MNDIVVIGGGGHGKVMISVLKRLEGFRVIGFTDIEKKEDVHGVPFLGDDDKLKEIIDERPSCMAAIGLGMVNEAGVRRRRAVYRHLELLGFTMPAIVAASAVVSDDVNIGSGVLVMDGVVINSGSVIGRCSILNTHCSVDHDSMTGDFSHIGPGATVCGHVVVGSNTLIGAGAVVCQGRKIGDGCVIGAGGVVIEDCEGPGTYVGVPARKIK
jgi:sugar O-acyltransferase (sialic acid O-acetyltransferase NeuD family)